MAQTQSSVLLVLLQIISMHIMMKIMAWPPWEGFSSQVISIKWNVCASVRIKACLWVVIVIIRGMVVVARRRVVVRTRMIAMVGIFLLLFLWDSCFTYRSCTQNIAILSNLGMLILSSTLTWLALLLLPITLERQGHLISEWFICYLKLGILFGNWIALIGVKHGIRSTWAELWWFTCLLGLMIGRVLCSIYWSILGSHLHTFLIRFRFIEVWEMLFILGNRLDGRSILGT